MPRRPRGRPGEGDVGVGQAGHGRARGGPRVGKEGVTRELQGGMLRVPRRAGAGWGPGEGMGFMGTRLHLFYSDTG